MDFLDKYTKEEIQSIIDNSYSYADILNNMGVSSNSGSSYTKLKYYLKLNPDIKLDNLLENKRKYKKRLKENELPTIFCKDSKTSQHKLRETYKKYNFSEYKCAICGLPPIWNGKSLVLNLDHIDGDNRNNTLSNLRWICPNCDRQLPTYGARNKKHVIYRCINCEKQISSRNAKFCKECKKIIKIKQKQNKNNKNSYKRHKKLCPICKKAKILKNSNMCLNCYNQKRQSKSNKPDRLVLKDLIRTKSFVDISKIYNVTDNTIRKWCKSYDLPYKAKDIKNISNEEWMKI